MSFAKDFVNNLQLSFVAFLETRVKERDAARLSVVIHRQFQWCYNYQHHLNGRIWVGWNPVFWTVAQLYSSAQQITMLVTRKADNSSFVLTVVYAYNEIVDRRTLWSDLIHINDSMVDSGQGRGGALQVILTLFFRATRLLGRFLVFIVVFLNFKTVSIILVLQTYLSRGNFLLGETVALILLCCVNWIGYW